MRAASIAPHRVAARQQEGKRVWRQKGGAVINDPGVNPSHPSRSVCECRPADR